MPRVDAPRSLLSNLMAATEVRPGSRQLRPERKKPLGLAYAEREMHGFGTAVARHASADRFHWRTGFTSVMRVANAQSSNFEAATRITDQALETDARANYSAPVCRSIKFLKEIEEGKLRR